MASASSVPWPPAPNVPSTTVMPGSRSSQATTSRPSTGMWGCSWMGRLFRQTLGNTLSTPSELLEGAGPGLAVPDLQPVPDARHDDVAPQVRVLHQRRRDGHASLAVHLRLGRAAEQVALE